MPGFRIQLGVKMKGKLFSTMNSKWGLDNLIFQITREVADYGKYLVLTRLSQVLRNPTGYYESQIRVDRVEKFFELSDNNVIYGPWLEGTGSRNAETNFPGYHTMSTVTRQLDQKKADIAKPFVDKYVAGMNS